MLIIPKVRSLVTDKVLIRERRLSNRDEAVQAARRYTGKIQCGVGRGHLSRRLKALALAGASRVNIAR